MLGEYKARSRKVELDGGSFELRGLSVDSLRALVDTHLRDLGTLFDLIGGVDGLTNGDLERIALALLNEAPGFVANVIALAAREPDAAPVASELPFPVQVEALMSIAELTFSEVGGIKKFAATVLTMLGRTGVTEKVAAAIRTRT